MIVDQLVANLYRNDSKYMKPDVLKLFLLKKTVWWELWESTKTEKFGPKNQKL